MTKRKKTNGKVTTDTTTVTTTTPAGREDTRPRKQLSREQEESLMKFLWQMHGHFLYEPNWVAQHLRDGGMSVELSPKGKSLCIEGQRLSAAKIPQPTTFSWGYDPIDLLLVVCGILGFSPVCEALGPGLFYRESLAELCEWLRAKRAGEDGDGGTG